MTPEKLAKIKALAEDTRGDPATRTIAMAALKRYGKVEPEKPTWTPPRNPPGVKTSPEWERQTFMSLNHWKRSKNGNFWHNVTHKGRGYHIVLFPHKKTPTFGWLRELEGEPPAWSARFRTIGEAHADAWRDLMSI